uniref:Uncharacterized protein n=1 Tax=Marseillevirus LCMAC103 TaxID=2506604 RepID=A0A481YVF0_9VIRU|nr:MAG: hypothetical protein LCMAC103_00960 [Marseillevirus LCMAC103]
MGAAARTTDVKTFSQVEDRPTYLVVACNYEYRNTAVLEMVGIDQFRRFVAKFFFDNAVSVRTGNPLKSAGPWMRPL